MTEVIKISTNPLHCETPAIRASKKERSGGFVARLLKLESKFFALPSDRMQALEPTTPVAATNPHDLSEVNFENYIKDMEREIDNVALTPRPIAFMNREPVVTFPETQAAIDSAYEMVDEMTATMHALNDLGSDAQNVTVVDFARRAESYGIDPKRALQETLRTEPK